MFVSFLIPTRGRTQYTEKLVKSIINNSSKKREFEILFKIDEDDWDTIRYFEKVLYPEFKEYIDYFITPRGKGYIDIHNYVNFLCEKSSGEWLFIFNDDCFMTTENWDDIIAETGKNGKEEICLLEPKEVNGPPNTFPIISRKWFEITERFSGCIYNDGWVEEIGKKLGILTKINIEIDHSIKYDINNGMQFNNKNRDDTFNDRLYAIKKIEYSSWDEALPEIEKDANKLKEYIDAQSKQLSI